MSEYRQFTEEEEANLRAEQMMSEHACGKDCEPYNRDWWREARDYEPQQFPVVTRWEREAEAREGSAEREANKKGAVRD